MYGLQARTKQAFDTAPDAEALQSAFPHNTFLSRRRRDGWLIQLEDWGAARVHKLKDDFGLERFANAQLFQLEMLNVVLVELSYREKRVLRVTLLADAAGITTEHVRLLPFLAKVRASLL